MRYFCKSMIGLLALQGSFAFATQETISKPLSAEATALPSASPEHIELLPESKLQLFGESTFHNFSSTATQIKVEGTLESNNTAPAGDLNLKLNDFRMTIPIAGLKSGNDTLDKHMYEAFQAEKFPKIHAELKNYEVTDNDKTSHKVSATIDLIVAGVTKTLPINATVTEEGAKIQVKGETKLLMTDFGIQPPVLMLGMIKTANEIKIQFELFFQLKKNTEKEKISDDQTNKI